MPLKTNQDSPSPIDLAARARELSAHAEALVSAITTLHHDIRAARDQSVRHAGFRCDTATSAHRALRSLLTNIDHGLGPAPRSKLTNIRGHSPRTKSQRTAVPAAPR